MATIQIHRQEEMDPEYPNREPRDQHLNQISSLLGTFLGNLIIEIRRAECTRTPTRVAGDQEEIHQAEAQGGIHLEEVQDLAEGQGEIHR